MSYFFGVGVSYKCSLLQRAVERSIELIAARFGAPSNRVGPTFPSFPPNLQPILLCSFRAGLLVSGSRAVGRTMPTSFTGINLREALQIPTTPEVRKAKRNAPSGGFPDRRPELPIGLG